MELILELLTEEMPPAHIKEACTQLEQLFPQMLVNNRLYKGQKNWGKLRVYGTCRRLIVHGLIVDSQPDEVEEIIGPPVSAAFAPDGTPTKAALGFARSRGLNNKDLITIVTERGEYAGFKTLVKGKSAQEILVRELPGTLSLLRFPKMMRWGSNTFRFSRPVKNIMCLLGGKPLVFSMGGLTSTGFTFGHSLYASEKIRAKSFSAFVKALQEKKVIIDLQKRQHKIRKQVEKKLGELDAQLLRDDELMEKLSYDVEWPLVILGAFPEDFLDLPIEVLSTAMKKGQNLFSVVRGKKQLPYFIGVADTAHDSRGLIRKGNERVLKARLEDARFFWEQDRRTALKEKAGGLEDVIYQEHLGSYADKVKRLRKLAAYLADKCEIRNEKKNLAEAAELCKADLLTEMVHEFPSLQGIMGGLYAREEKYPAAVWKAVYEHYAPGGMDDTIPSSVNGMILSLADKIDSIVGGLGVGLKVSGSKDPFGLRRNAQGVCRIILEKKMSLSFPRLLDKSIALFEDHLTVPKAEIKALCLEFFKNRLEYLFTQRGFRYDLIEAALGAGMDNITHVFHRVKALDSLKDSPQFESMILIAKRVNNILKAQPAYHLNTGLFCEKEERELHTTFMIIKENVAPLLAQGEFLRAQKMIFRMRSSIDGFFDKVLVMAKEAKIRRNRLALLQDISRLLLRIADYSKVVVSEE